MTTIAAENAKQIRRSMDVLIQVTPQTGDPIIINNDNLIRAVVSLRSDLSILEPTLPESEINIEAYFDTDISDILASIPDETPVTYQAGYDGDMSPVRKFYLAEQITWADNVMSIHAVDAVHLLEKETLCAILAAPPTRFQGSFRASNVLYLCRALINILAECGLNDVSKLSSFDVQIVLSESDKKRNYQNIIFPKQTAKNIFAKVMNLMHQDYPTDYFMGDKSSIWINYVDAGIPSLTFIKPTATYNIREEDCGDVSLQTERKITGIELQINELSFVSQSTFFKDRKELGGGTWIKDEGIFLNFDSPFINTFAIGYYDNDVYKGVIGPVYDGDDSNSGFYGYVNNSIFTAYLVGPDIPNGAIKYPATNVSHGLYTQVVPWSQNQGAAWDNYVSDSTATNVQVVTRGAAYVDNATTKNYGTAGNIVKITEEDILGRAVTVGSDSTRTPEEVFPKRAYESLLQRSNITGSFTWKGDPRMQPRDVFTFHRLDGTDEVCTLENITITHEKGGTSAEITYRKGIC